MTDTGDDRGPDVARPETTDGDAAGSVPASATRRGLMLGAAAASTVVTIRPALAQAAGSVMNCQIPVPDPRMGSNKWIDPRGRVVDAGTPGAFRAPNRPFTAEQVKKAMQGANFPNADYDTSRAYMAYIRKMQNGTSGFTCYQSLQMPRP
ncbi:hypothetical protein [Sphingomonas profundi]|uniref:hypothetical protein n=1 Tax=Alterirhizorhabdus profundi TaxID=2681549 RepID=UPI0012E7F8DE|nr:hypothetical protein [Sphingomonas profundi]